LRPAPCNAYRYKSAQADFRYGLLASPLAQLKGFCNEKQTFVYNKADFANRKITKGVRAIGVILLTEYHASSIRLPASDIATQ